MKNLLKISGLAFMCGLTTFGADAATFNCIKHQLSWNSFKASNEYLFVEESDNSGSAGHAYVCGHKEGGFGLGNTVDGCNEGVKIAVGQQGGNIANRNWGDRKARNATVFRCSTSGSNRWVAADVTSVSACTSTSGKNKYFSVSWLGQTYDVYGTAGASLAGEGNGYAIDPCWVKAQKAGGKDGIDGKDGKDGKDGIDGKDGKDGKDGIDGKDGKDGVDGKDANSPNNTNNNQNNANANGGEGGAGYGEGGVAYGEQSSTQRLNSRNAAEGGAANSSADFSNTFRETFAGANFGTIKLTDRFGDYIEGADCTLLMNNGNTINAKNGENAIGAFDLNFCKSVPGIRSELTEFGTDFWLRCYNKAFVCCPKTCEKGYTPAPGLDGCGCVKNAGNGGGGGSSSCMNRPTEEGRACCKAGPKSLYDYDDISQKCICSGRLAGKVFENRDGRWECYDQKPKEDDKPVTTVTCDGNTGAMLVGNACRCTYSETRLVMEGTFGHCVCSDPNKELKGSVCEYGQSYIAKFEKTIREVRGRLDGVMGTFKESVWKDEDGNFNTARLASDSIAGIVLGTTGGLVTSKLVKKNQLKKGFEAVQCSVGGQTAASFGDEFTVGLQ